MSELCSSTKVGEMTHQALVVILICQNQSHKVEKIVLKWMSMKGWNSERWCSWTWSLICANVFIFVWCILLCLLDAYEYI